MNVGELRKALEGVDDSLEILLDRLVVSDRNSGLVTVSIAEQRTGGSLPPLSYFGLEAEPFVEHTEVLPQHRARSCGALAPGAGVPGGKR